MQIDIKFITEVAIGAGQEILKVYNDTDQFNQVEMKEDNSPLTLADKASNEFIVSRLKERYPEIPIMSEEDVSEVAFEERSGWESYWCVDPLDGTKEFIKRNGEFTVNIALIENRFPALGVIHVPVSGETYVGSKSTGAYKVDFANSPETIETRTKNTERVAVRSRSHASEDEDALYEKFQVTDFISKGSSLKFCILAEGKADLYYRHNPTMEWDTAAGQAILEAAGGHVYRGNKTEERFFYNKEDLRNGSFLCTAFGVE